MNSKILGIVVVVLIIILGLWLALRTPSAPAVPSGDLSGQTPVPADQLVAGIEASGSSDQALDHDAAAIDAELSGFTSDNASAQNDQ